MLRREKGTSLEERNHPLEQILAVSNHKNESSIVLAIRLDVATAEPLAEYLEHLSPVTVLADMELRNELKPDTTRRVALHRDREASFSVDVPRDVAVQPFLLIVRTRHVVTIVNVRPDVTMSSAGYSEFPAYSQILFLELQRSRPIVTAAIDRGFGSRLITPPLDLPASGRRHPLYVRFRVCRELCFW